MPTTAYIDHPTLESWFNAFLEQLRGSEARIEGFVAGMEEKLNEFEQLNCRAMEQLVNLNQQQRLDLIETNRALRQTEQTLGQVLEGDGDALGNTATDEVETKIIEANRTLWFLLTELNFLNLRMAQESDECESGALELQIKEFQNEIMTEVNKSIPCA